MPDSISAAANQRQWRLINDTHTSGGRNMAVDEAILRVVGAGEQPPTLRLYGWNPPCLSLGYGQRAQEANVVALLAHGWDIVRRPTGGRAILHIDELTYSFALPIEHPLARGGIIESYRTISAALMRGLQLLGAFTHAERTSNDLKPTTPVCFDTPSHYEITVGGRKLIGSAQTRRANGLLQHGTLPLTGDIARICDVLAFESANARDVMKKQVRSTAITLEEAIQRPIEWHEAAVALIAGFTETFDAAFSEGALSTVESALADQLQQNTYTNEAWTFRR